MSADGLVPGTYVHGLFAADGFRRAWLKVSGCMSTVVYEARIENALDALADHLERHLDVERILAIARTVRARATSAARAPHAGCRRRRTAAARGAMSAGSRVATAARIQPRIVDDRFAVAARSRER